MSEQRPLVSVIIPCYNQARFLGEAIESVLNQTYQGFEIVVVDDGSSDHTAAVAARYSGARYLRQDNQGLSAARNAGARQSRGEYLVFLDADDRLLPDALEVGIESLKAHPECAFVSGRCGYMASDGTPILTPPQPPIEKDHYLKLLESNCIYGCMAVMFRRSVFEQVSGFDAALRSCEDYELYLRIARQFPIHCHNILIAQYRRHGASMSHSHTLMLKSVLQVLRSQKGHIKGIRPYEEAYRSGIRHHQELYGERIVEEVRAGVHSRQWGRAIRGALALLRYFPRGLARHARRKSYCFIFRPEN